MRIIILLYIISAGKKWRVNMKRDYIQREIVGMPNCILYIWKDHWKITYKDVEIVNERLECHMRELITSAETYFNNAGVNGTNIANVTGDFCISHQDLVEIKLVGIIKGTQEVEVYIEVVRTG